MPLQITAFLATEGCRRTRTGLNGSQLCNCKCSYLFSLYFSNPAIPGTNIKPISFAETSAKSQFTSKNPPNPPPNLAQVCDSSYPTSFLSSQITIPCKSQPITKNLPNPPSNLAHFYSSPKIPVNTLNPRSPPNVLSKSIPMSKILLNPPPNLAHFSNYSFVTLYCSSPSDLSKTLSKQSSRIRPNPPSNLAHFCISPSLTSFFSPQIKIHTKSQPINQKLPNPLPNLAHFSNCSFISFYSSSTKNSSKSLNPRPSLRIQGKSLPITKILANPPPNLARFSNYSSVSFYSSSSNDLSKTLKSSPSLKTHHKSKNVNKTPPNQPPNLAQFHKSLSQLPARFTPEDLSEAITREKDPHVCLQLFNWASQQPRFKHNESTYHITIKKLGSAKLYEPMDNLANQVLSNLSLGSEPLFNTIIYFYTEFRKLQKAVNAYKHMKKSKNLSCRPSLRTYNLLFTSLLSRGSNSYINHMYMQTIRCLFGQMVDDGIQPDIFSLNSMIKGYVLSLHLNDALRIFHQMEVVYNCLPNSHSYDYLIHGLCAQGRTINAKELYREMVEKGFVPSSKAYNSLVNCLAVNGEVEESVNLLWEMNWRKRMPDIITYRTVLDVICRKRRVAEAIGLLKELQEKDLVDGHTYRNLLYDLQDKYCDSDLTADKNETDES